LEKAPKKMLSIQILVVVEHHVEVMVKDNMVTMATIINNKKVNPEVEEETLKEGGVMEAMVRVIEVNNQAMAQIAIIARNLDT
jgi:hypothetical protein